MLLGMLKASPVALLGLGALMTGTFKPAKACASPAYVTVVGLGLLMGSLGDFFLELERDGKPQFFVLGLASFLLSHLAYIGAFVADSRAGAFTRPLFLGATVAFGGLAGGLVWILLPGVKPDLVAPVIVYATAIALMGAMATGWWPKPFPINGAYTLAMAGAAFFVLSDSVLSYNKFAAPVPSSRWVIMTTYYAAQTLIAMSASRRWSAASSAAAKDE